MNTLIKKSNGNGYAPATFSGIVDKIFHNNINRFLDDDFWGFNGLERQVNVPVNVRETEKSYEVDVVAPGLKKEDFKVQVNGDVLTVAFEQEQRNSEQSDKDGWLRREYKTRAFSRSFTLDDALDASKITAQYTDGILRLSISKKEGATAISRTIEIQ